MRTVRKVVPCVIQNGSILCLRHPLAGNQLLKGTAQVGESLVDAALRELEEESGLVWVEPVEHVGSFERLVEVDPAGGGKRERHVWTVFLISASGLDDSWGHLAVGSPEEEGLRFSYYWHPLAAKPAGFLDDAYARVILMVREYLRGRDPTLSGEERCELVDASARSVGRIVTRGVDLRSGEFYLVVHVWIRDEAGAYLVQKRASDLEDDPGMWATTAGYVLAGEDSVSAAVREVNEELGIDLSSAELHRFARVAVEGRVEDRWLASVRREAVGSPWAGKEVSDWAWVSKRRLARMVARGEFISYSYFDALPG